MTADGGLNRWEVMSMTNAQRKTWIDLMTDRAKQQKEARDNAGSKGSKGPNRLG